VIPADVGDLAMTIVLNVLGTGCKDAVFHIAIWPMATMQT